MITYKELSSLEQDLGIPAKTLYGVSNNIGKHYRTSRIPKKRGGFRELTIPDAILKSIQRRIADVLLLQMPVSTYAKAYKYGTSVAKNARVHIGKPLVLKLDILHFFDSIRYCSVKDIVFPPEKYSEPIRILLTMLCYYRDGLPQGAPSSPAITNILLYSFDESVGKWCSARKISYTRYCDDMTFSGEFVPADVIAFIRQELQPFGLLLNKQKTRIEHANTRQIVTGVVVNEKAQVPISYRRALLQEIYYCQKYGIADHLSRTHIDLTAETYKNMLLGKINFILQINPSDKKALAAADWLKTEARTDFSATNNRFEE